MHLIVATIGSLGDFLPFFGLAQLARDRGHDVDLLTSTAFRETTEAAGVRFHEISTREEDAVRKAALGDRRLRTMLRPARPMVVTTAQRAADQVRRLYRPGRSVVVSQAWCLGARIGADSLRAPYVSVHVQPFLFRDTSSLASRWRYALKDRAADRLLAPELNRIRADRGLPPLRRFFHTYVHSPLLSLGLFPPAFADVRPGWPSPLLLTGFPYVDAGSPLDEELRRFLDAGSPPVVIAQATHRPQNHRYLAGALAAVRQLGRRAVLITGAGEPLPGVDGDTYQVPFTSFRQLLPRAAAIVHQAGIGTIAEAVLAGVPQLVLPLLPDQQVNALRVEQLGLGLRSRDGGTAPQLAEQLRRLFASPWIAERLAEWRTRTRATGDGLSTACDAIERLGREQALVGA